MGGVGKTTMVKKIENKVRQEKIFEEVVMAVVSQPLDLHKVQQEIAEKLGLTLDKQTTPARAEKLHQRLKVKKSVLVILDDVWDDFNLQEIGIPSKSSLGGCKVILTSRDKDACTKIEDSAKIIQLDVLSEREAWNLFKEKAGVKVDEPDLHPIAVDVAKECEGLPLALVTVAAALRHRDIPSWRAALTQFKGSHPENIVDFKEKVHLRLKWSYDQLPDEEEIRYLFLLCCMFPEDYTITVDTLVRYGFGLRIFPDIANLTDARDRVYYLIGILKDRFLLIGGTDDGVKMHDVIRDMAISIASKEQHGFMVTHDKDLREWPKKDSYHNYRCISLGSECKIVLSEKLDCPRLEVLCLSFIVGGVEIQESSLTGMRGLKVLTTCMVQSLPSSLSFLTNLRSLFLERSELKILPNEIGELVKLEILSLADSKIVMLQKEIGRLKNLKLLDLTDCSRLKNVVPGMISELVQLEELLMLKSFNNWEAEGIERNNASLAEVASLTKLTTLEIEIPRPDSINFTEDARNWCTLKRYHVAIGEPYSFAGSERCIKLNLHKSVLLTISVRALLNDAELMELSGEGSSEIANQLARDGFQKVKILYLRNWGNLEPLFDSSSSKQTDSAFLPRATELYLQDTDFLKEVCRGHPPAGSFSKLTSIDLRRCNGLKNLFSFSVAAMLSTLESVNIDSCDVLETVFFEQKGQSGSNATSKITFPKLSEITLHSLPSLSSFCKATDTNTFEFPQLYKMQLYKIPSFKSFCAVQEDDHNAEQQFSFDQKIMCSGVKHLSFDKINCKLVFPNIISCLNCDKVILSRLKNLNFGDMNCKILFPNSISCGGFSNLEDLSVWECKELEEVIGKDKEEGTNSEVILFPRLRQLGLSHLPMMRQFCHVDRVKLPSLESLVITDCQLMETFCQSSQLIDSSIDTSSFFDKVILSRLKNLNFGDMNCKILFPNSISCGGFSNLEDLSVRGCKELEEVIGKDKEEGTNSEVILFPRLRQLGLSHLPMMRQFCHMDRVKLPSLESLFITDCQLMETFCQSSQLIDSSIDTSSFFDKVILSRLKNLNFGDMNCKILFPNSISCGGFSNLEDLSVRGCKELEEVIGKDKEEGTNSEVILFPRLRQLGLSHLPMMRQFCHMDRVKLPSLESLVITDCQLMETFCQSSQLIDSSIDTSSFFDKVILSRLKNLNFGDMNCKILFPNSISCGGFSNLEDLSVWECKELEEVIGKDKEEGTNSEVILFPRLRQLGLSHLPMMRQFCHVDRVKLPSLESLVITDCQLMETFCQSSQLIDSSIDTSSFFDKVILSRLKNLNFGDMNCKILFPNSISCGGFSNLEDLSVRGCKELEEVIGKDKEEGTNSEVILFPRLRQLGLSHLPMMRQFCHMDRVKLPSLESLFITDCQLMETFCQSSQLIDSSIDTSSFFDKVILSRLKNLNFGDMNCKILFPNSISCGGFSNLEDLSVRGCKELEEVIGKDKEEGTNSEVILFPRLRQLGLSHLPMMRQFCHMDRVKLPSLESLVITDCQLMETFCQSSQLIDSSIDTSSFFDKVILSRLKNLNFGDMNCKILFPNSISCGGFSNLEDLSVRGCKELEEVIGKDKEEGTNSEVILFPRLRQLGLSHLPKMRQFCHMDRVKLPSLESLVICDCWLMETFCQSSQLIDSSIDTSSFFDKVILSGLKNLTFRDMNCKILFPNSISCGGFSNLEDLSVRGCKELEEVIGKDKEVGTNSEVILFPRLRQLGLSHLPKMRQFCHMDRVKLPSLESLVICDCWLMETFCRSSQLIDSSIDTSSFFDKITCSRIRILKLRNLNAPSKLFGHRISIDNFGALKKVDIRDCNSLKSLFSPPMFRGLLNLQKLELSGCPILEEVISEEEKEYETNIGETLFPQLQHLALLQLPKLIRFCHIKHDLRLPSLERITIKDCPVLETFSLGSVSFPSSARVSGPPQHSFTSQYFSEEQIDSNDTSKSEDGDDLNDTLESEDGDEAA